MRSDEEPKFETAVLGRLKWAVQWPVSRAFVMDSGDLGAFIANMVIVRVEAILASGGWTETDAWEEVPDGWWQALKQALPFWARRWLRLTARMRRIPTSTRVYRVCPHLMLRADETHVRFLAGKE